MTEADNTQVVPGSGEHQYSPDGTHTIIIDHTWVNTDLELANEIMQTVWQRRHTPGTPPAASAVRVERDGNLTLVFLTVGNQVYTGWSKFNPNDIRTSYCVSKKGKWYRKTESCFSEKVGTTRAIHRAVEKVLAAHE